MSELKCMDLIENIMSYIDKELDQVTLFTLEKHIELCPECKSFVETYKRMLKLSGNLKNQKFVTPDIRQRLKNVLKTKIKPH
jgi:anti-sigma factor RsiW